MKDFIKLPNKRLEACPAAPICHVAGNLRTGCLGPETEDTPQKCIAGLILFVSQIYYSTAPNDAPLKEQIRSAVAHFEAGTLLKEILETQGQKE